MLLHEERDAMQLTADQRDSLAAWRREVLRGHHLLDQQRLVLIEDEIRQWPQVQELDSNSNFFELLAVCDARGVRTGARAWRGICHWLWLRHECVDGMLFTPSELAVVQKRAAWVSDSPGALEMSFAGHVGTAKIRAATRADGPQALESEAAGEAGVDLFSDSQQIRYPSDLEPIAEYAQIDPPRPRSEFYNAEYRRVFAVRLSEQGVAAIYPRDREVACFLLLPFEEAWSVLQTEQVSSSLRVSGPIALYHAMREWGYAS